MPVGDGLVALLDAEDFARFGMWQWSVSNGYAMRMTRENGRQRGIKLHREVLGVTDPAVQVDHINGNRLDNRRCNLRPAGFTEQRCNQGVRRDSRSGIKGVVRRESGRWQARIRYRGQRRNLGTFATVELAAAAYAVAATELHGEYARTA
jgi:hypothetical protein